MCLAGERQSQSGAPSCMGLWLPCGRDLPGSDIAEDHASFGRASAGGVLMPRCMTLAGRHKTPPQTAGVWLAAF